MSKRQQVQTQHSSQIVVDGIVMNAEFPDVITLRKVRVLDGFRVRMTFSNDEIRELDLKSYLRGPIFEPLRRDIQFFRRVFVDAETETLTWHNGADMDPQTLYEDSTPVSKSVRLQKAIHTNHSRPKSRKPTAHQRKTSPSSKPHTTRKSIK